MKKTLNGGIELGFLNAISDDRELTDSELATQKELELHPKGEWIYYDENNNVISREKYCEVFIKRMKRLNIDIELVGNYPWIYIDKINNKKVKEKFQGNHGFTIAFLPIRKEQKMKFTDIGEIFRLVRKYCT